MTGIKKVVVALLFGVLLVSSTPTASAYSYSDSARLAELQAMIIRLQAELARLQAGQYYGGSTVSGDVEVLKNGSVELQGVAGGTSGSVRAWFEYGPTYSMQYSTPMTTVNAGRTFYGVADDIDRNRTYYYRAVTEDRHGDITESATRSFVVTTGSNYNDDRDWRDEDEEDEDRPEVTTDEADDVEDDRAELRGEVDMQDAEDGIVFFVYGEDEDMVEEVTDEDRYSNIDTDGDDLRIVRVDSSFDGDDDFYAVVTGLDDSTDHYFRICVEYEDEDNDERLECGDVESFETD
jgi:type II secretory pathway pseudopilin PulG